MVSTVGVLAQCLQRITAESRGWLVPLALGGNEVAATVRLMTSSTVYLSVGPDDVVLSLHPPRQDLPIPRSPTSIHLGEWGFVSDLYAGAPARLSHGDLSISTRGGDITCSLTEAPVWRPYRNQTGQEFESAVVANALEELAPIQEARHRLGSRVDKLVCVLMDSRKSLVRSATGELQTAIDALVGFGPGLTPSGDDVLVGCLLGLTRWGYPEAPLSAFRAAIVDRLRADNATTFVGRHVLAHACVGVGHEAIENLLQTPGDHDFVGFQSAISQLLGVGATSGADTLLGLRAALHVLDPDGAVPSRRNEKDSR